MELLRSSGLILQYISQEKKNIANLTQKKIPILCSPSLNLTENMLLIRFDSIYELEVFLEES